MLTHEVQGRTRGKATDDRWSLWFRLGASGNPERAQGMLEDLRARELVAGREVVIEAESGFRVEDIGDGTWYEYRLFLRDTEPVTTSMVRFECGCVGWAPEPDGTTVLVWSCDGTGYGFSVWNMTGRNFRPLSASDERAVRAAMSKMSLVVW